MTDQLVLIDSHPAWRMDSPTRELGIRGVARARQALQEARTKAMAEESTTEDDAEPADRLAPAA